MLLRIIGRDRCRLSRLHDEKGNRVSVRQIPDMIPAALCRISQSLTDWPYLPWIPFEVMKVLSGFLSRKSRVLEFGSGRSTIWFARRAQSVISIEDNREWSEKITVLLRRLEINNVDYRLRAGPDYFDARGFESEQFDLIVVDGNYRSKCIELFHPALKAGGILYLDNSDKDMTREGGDLRRAEAKILELSECWASPPRYFTGFCPGNLGPHQGVMIRKEAPAAVAPFFAVAAGGV